MSFSWARIDAGLKDRPLTRLNHKFKVSVESIRRSTGLLMISSHKMGEAQASGCRADDHNSLLLIGRKDVLLNRTIRH